MNWRYFLYLRREVTMPDPDPKESILISVKKVLGIAAEYDAFDLDILMHINSVISTLQQLGVNLTDEQIEVEDDTTLWSELLTTQKNLAMVKSYMYMSIRQIFDPHATGFVTDSFDRQIKELGWRIMVAASSTPNRVST
jgi:hypothetical protein